MMKKNYQQPATTVVSVAAHGHILDGSNPVSKMSSNTNIGYGGGGTGSARVKDATEVYDVWDDDWQGQ